MQATTSTPWLFAYADRLRPHLSAYTEYTVVNSLNINLHKTAALCIKTPAGLCAQLQQIVTTPIHMKH
jgi:hypothetical protein